MAAEKFQIGANYRFNTNENKLQIVDKKLKLGVKLDFSGWVLLYIFLNRNELISKQTTLPL